jgi:hypothetical protein
MPRGKLRHRLDHIDDQLALKTSPGYIAEHSLPDFTLEARYLGRMPPQVRLFIRPTGPASIRKGTLFNLLVPRALGSFKWTGSQPQSLMDSDENLDSDTGVREVPAWLWVCDAPVEMKPGIAYPLDYVIGNPRPGRYPLLLRIVGDGERKEAGDSLVVPEESAASARAPDAPRSSLGTATPGSLRPATVRETLARLIEEGAALRDRYTDILGMRPVVDGEDRDPDEMKARIAEWVTRTKLFVRAEAQEWSDDFHGDRLMNLNDGRYVRDFMETRLNELRSIRERVTG